MSRYYQIEIYEKVGCIKRKQIYYASTYSETKTIVTRCAKELNREYTVNLVKDGYIFPNIYIKTKHPILPTNHPIKDN